MALGHFDKPSARTQNIQFDHRTTSETSHRVENPIQEDFAGKILNNTVIGLLGIIAVIVVVAIWNGQNSQTNNYSIEGNDTKIEQHRAK